MRIFFRALTPALLTASFIASVGTPSAEASLDLLEIVARAERGLITSVEEVLDAFPRQTRARHALVYDSRNTAQFASPEFPRALFFGADLRSAAAVSGNPNGVGYRTVELIRWDPTERRNVFYSIDFSSGAPKVLRDPPTCFACHRGRFIWDAYPVWPGLFGSQLDYGFYDADTLERELVARFLAARGGAGDSRYSRFMNVAKISANLYGEFNGKLTVELAALGYRDEFARLDGATDASRRFRVWLLRAFGMGDADFVASLRAETGKDLTVRLGTIRSEVARRNIRYMNESLDRQRANLVSIDKFTFDGDTLFTKWEAKLARVLLLYETAGMTFHFEGFGGSRAYGTGILGFNEFAEAILLDFEKRFVHDRAARADLAEIRTSIYIGPKVDGIERGEFARLSHAVEKSYGLVPLSLSEWACRNAAGSFHP